MLIPLGIPEFRRRATVVTWWLIGLNFVCMFAQQLIQRFGGADEYWRMILDFGWTSFDKPWGLVTYQFLHGDLWHLGGNMLFLWVFGSAVEQRIGRWLFLLLYLTGGFAAAVTQFVFSEPITIPLFGGGVEQFIVPTIGASGSVAAVTGAFLVLAPRAPMRIFSLLFIGVFMVPSWWFIGLAIMMDFVFQTYASATGRASDIAHAAHLGGYAFGFGVAMLLLARGWVEREPYNLFTAQRQARRRRAFKLAVEEAERQNKSTWVNQAREASVESVDESAEDLARRRLVGLVRDGKMDEAAREFETFVAEHPGSVVSRDSQIAIAQHLYGAGSYELASVALESFLDRYRSDREASGVALMLAVVQGRYLSSMDLARSALGRVDRSKLGAGELAMFEELAGEFGFEAGSEELA